MKRFTYADIENWNPCYPPNRHLPHNWSGTALDILDNKQIPFEDRLWVIMRSELVSEKLMRLFAVWCVRQIQHLMNDKRSLNALDVAEAFANGNATKNELDAAGDAARDAAWDAAWDAARDAARAAARAAVWEAARAAARAAVWEAARAAVWEAALAAAWDAALAAQETKLREMLIAGIKTGDVILETLKKRGE